MDNRGIFRILDAAANRAAEGLRTAEEFARFVLDDAGLTEQAKQLRHALADAVATLPREALLAARDTPADVGTAIDVPSESQRNSALDVAVAAMARTQQSLRCLEEYGKIVAPRVTPSFEQIRYRSYTLAQRLELAAATRMRIAHARLYVLVDLAGEPEEWIARLRQLAACGADLIQIRDKGASDRLLFERCLVAAQAICQGPAEGRCQLIINDRADIAAAVNADGVHVGQDELPVAAARRVVGPHKLVGLSTHSIEQAREAVALGADYIGCGPTFPSRTKQFSAFAGIPLLRQVSAEVTIPAFAIGGIDASGVVAIKQAGFERIAVGEAVWGGADLAGACRALRDQLDTAVNAEQGRG